MAQRCSLVPLLARSHITRRLVSSTEPAAGAVVDLTIPKRRIVGAPEGVTERHIRVVLRVAQLNEHGQR